VANLLLEMQQAIVWVSLNRDFDVNYPAKNAPDDGKYRRIFKKCQFG
jgi:hypothetical protein